MTPRRAWWLLLALLLGGAAAVEARRVAGDLSTPRDHHLPEYVGSDACRRCHPERHASWARTFHRRMTAEASAESVLGAFDGRSLRYFGVTARMWRDPAGRFFMDFTAPGRAPRRVEVVRTVGSHRYQQYLGRHEDVYFRLPIAWQVDEQRFMHMNEAFLTPDPQPPPRGEAVDRGDFDRHVTRWNDNCIFCHNVAPNPGLMEGDSDRVHFASEVAELGIACEACHGPGSEHEALNTDPFRRYALHLSGRPDPTIVSPARLDAARASEVCGRCHGQRKTAHLGAVLAHGDGFVPGDALGESCEPLFRDTPLEGDRRAFAPRFWADGTPRLTAYELQGLLLSPCARGGELSCLTCHSMHDAAPDGQVRAEARGDAACLGCHGDLAADHSRHLPGSATCPDCHMPPIVYGLIGAHISHRVELPAPREAARLNRPDACTLCHLDRRRAWAIAARDALWATPPATTPPAVDDALPEVTRALFAGDPIERAIAAAALGRANAAPGAPPGALARRCAWLLEVLRADPYPAVRTGAWRSLRALLGDRAPPRLARFVPTATPTEREAFVRGLREELSSLNLPALDLSALDALRAAASRREIEIGE